MPCARAVGDRATLIAERGEELLERFAHRRFVIDDEDPPGDACRSGPSVDGGGGASDLCGGPSEPPTADHTSSR